MLSFPTMPSFPPLRCTGLFRRRVKGGEGSGSDGEDDPIANSVECYACTQVGVPGFHSTSCDSVHKPHWEAFAGSSLYRTVPDETASGKPSRARGRRPPQGPFGRILDPRSKRVRRWNRALVLARGFALAIDPLFFYALSFAIGSGGAPCIYVNGGLAAVVTVLRTCVDTLHLSHVWLQFRLAYVSRESLVVGCGKLVWDARAIASHYLRSLRGFWFDVFVILPIPQELLTGLALWFWLLLGCEEFSVFHVIFFSPRDLLLFLFAGCCNTIVTVYLAVVSFWKTYSSMPVSFFFLKQVVFWLVIPKLIVEEEIKLIMTILLLIFLFQFLPRAYHCLSLMRRMQKVTGYIFGSVWWGFGINLIAYLIASHVAGGCWYVLSTQRVVTCLQKQCERKRQCNFSLSCSKEVSYEFWNPRGFNSEITEKPLCMEDDGPFNYGIYTQALPVISSNSLAVRILYPIFWGLLNLSSFGNELEPTSNLVELTFSICIVLIGLVLFTLLIGNIQVSLSVVMAKKKQMSLRRSDMEWWMRRRQLPSRLRQRVHHFERQKWETMGGEDEMELIKDLPEGLRRDIKRYLCLDLIRKVPLFHSLGDLILDNICDRVHPLLFSKDEKVIREGDPVQRMVFIVAGRVKSSQSLTKGTVATSELEPGSFFGDELLSWSLRRPFIDRLPASSATFLCLESTRAYGIDAKDLRYITDNFRYKFTNEKLKRTARYYSTTWRTWAAVNIQFAWQRYKRRTRGPMIIVTQNESNNIEQRLRQYAAMFMSLRPHDHLE